MNRNADGAASGTGLMWRRPVEMGLIKQFNLDVSQLLSCVTHGLFLAADAHDFFGKEVEPVLERLLNAVALAYRETPPGLSQIQAAEVSRAILGLGTILRTDIDAALENDPATKDAVEVLFSYPGFKAITAHRVAHLLLQKGVPLVPRMLSAHAHHLTGIDIHPGAQIGTHFFIDHGTGVVIGETSIIGNHVTLYQGVTLGAKRFKRDEHGQVIKGQARHPILGDRVTVYAGAAILGRITIGAGSMIGGNVWLTESVPANSRITQQQFVAGLFRDGDGI